MMATAISTATRVALSTVNGSSKALSQAGKTASSSQTTPENVATTNKKSEKQQPTGMHREVEQYARYAEMNGFS